MILRPLEVNYFKFTGEYNREQSTDLVNRVIELNIESLFMITLCYYWLYDQGLTQKI